MRSMVGFGIGAEGAPRGAGDTQTVSPWGLLESPLAGNYRKSSFSWQEDSSTNLVLSEPLLFVWGGRGGVEIKGKNRPREPSPREKGIAGNGKCTQAGSWGMLEKLHYSE